MSLVVVPESSRSMGVAASPWAEPRATLSKTDVQARCAGAAPGRTPLCVAWLRIAERDERWAPMRNDEAMRLDSAGAESETPHRGQSSSGLRRDAAEGLLTSRRYKR